MATDAPPIGRSGMVTPFMPAAASTVHQVTAGTGSVLASVTTGIALGGAIVGILAGVATVVTLVIFAVVTLRKGRKDYEQEIRDAEERGKKAEKEEIQPWLDYYKDVAQGRLRLPPPLPLPTDHE